ncbi:hypothetical protein ANO11243_041160 [Dothideomycetidae sp. 11243]|nr:hypothetical protein ANO11243_041160 [fungal sp. No.11243]
MHSSTSSPVSPANSFRKVKAVYSPLGSPMSSFINMADAVSASSSRAQSPSRFSTTSNFSSLSLGHRSTRNMIRRKPSTVELELEEERRCCGDELIGLVEPRPNGIAAHLSGIEEVIFGRLVTDWPLSASIWAWTSGHWPFGDSKTMVPSNGTRLLRPLLMLKRFFTIPFFLFGLAEVTKTRHGKWNTQTFEEFT